MRRVSLYEQSKRRKNRQRRIDNFVCAISTIGIVTTLTTIILISGGYI